MVTGLGDRLLLPVIDVLERRPISDLRGKGWSSALVRLRAANQQDPQLKD